MLRGNLLSFFWIVRHPSFTMDFSQSRIVSQVVSSPCVLMGYFCVTDSSFVFDVNRLNIIDFKLKYLFLDKYERQKINPLH